MSASKTNAMRILDGQHIQYNILSYDHQDGKIDGMNVAEKIDRAPEIVFKTLVAHSKQNLFVFVIPVHKELDLKKAAKSAGEKKIEMLPVKDLQKFTGYIRGGQAPHWNEKALPHFYRPACIGTGSHRCKRWENWDPTGVKSARFSSNHSGSVYRSNAYSIKLTT